MMVIRRYSARALMVAACLAAGSVGAVCDAEAQQSPDWRIEPAVGVFIDAYDNGLDGNGVGVNAALGVSRALGSTVRGIVSLSAARSSHERCPCPVAVERLLGTQ